MFVLLDVMNTAETIVCNVVGVSEVLLALLLVLLILVIFHLNIFQYYV